MIGANVTGAILAVDPPSPLKTPPKEPPAQAEIRTETVAKTLSLTSQLVMRPAAAVRMLNTRSDSIMSQFQDRAPIQWVGSALAAPPHNLYSVWTNASSGPETHCRR